MFTHYGVSKEDINTLARKACSRGNFAVKIMQIVFNKEELVGRNCNGKKGKMALDSSKISLVKSVVSRVYNVPTTSCKFEEMWKKCVVAIDECLRRASKPPTLNQAKRAKAKPDLVKPTKSSKQVELVSKSAKQAKRQSCG